MESVVLGLATYLLETVKLFCVMRFLLRFEMRPRYYIICSMVFFLIPAGLLGFWGNLTPAAYLSILVMLITFRGKGKVLYGMLAVVSISCFDSLCTAIVLLFLDMQYISLGDNALSLFLVNTVSVPFLLLLIWGVRAWQNKRMVTTGRETGRQWLLFVLIGEVAFSFLIQSFQMVITDEIRYGKMIAVALCIGSIVIVLTMVFLLVSITTKDYYKSVALINERLVKSQTEYYEMLLEKEEETKAFRHDIRNHFSCMRLLFEKEEMEALNEYFNKMGIMIGTLKPEVQTGNRMVDVIISSVAKKYPAVNYRINGMISEELKLDNHDLCIIFFNLLDNAFAAAEKSDEKRVELSFYEKEKMFFSTIENTILNPVIVRNNRIMTEKPDKRNHGYGTVNAVKCVEQNGGELRFTCEEELFKAEIVLFV